MNFKRFDTSDNQWHDIPYYTHKTATDTITTLPADIYPNDTTATIGLKGQTVQSGTPNPDTPIMPQGTGERTANEWNVTILSNSSISAENYWEKYDSSTVSTTMYMSCEANTTYYLYTPSSITSGIFRVYTSTSDTIPTLGNSIPVYEKTRSSSPISVFKFTTGTTDKMLIIQVTTANSQTMANNAVLDKGYKIPISMGGTTNNVYLGEVQTTRQIKKYAFTGKESFARDADYNRFILTLQDAKIEGLRLTQVYCTNFTSVYDGRPVSDVPNNAIYSSDVATNKFFIKTTDYTDEPTFKAWLAQQYANGTPVTVWYVLDTPQTAIVNKPLMKIGTYADSLTTSIPCTAGSNTLDVQTTVAPSEVTAGFSGWHPITDVHIYPDSSWMPTSWGEFRKAVRLGKAPELYPVGTKLYENWGDTTSDAWIVVDYPTGEDYLDSDLAQQGYTNRVMLIEEKINYLRVFDNQEAWLYAETAIPAGTYRFKIPNYDATYGGNKTYIFTSTADVPVGGQLTLTWTYQQNPSAVQAYSSSTDTSSIFNVSITEWDGTTPCTDLGTIKLAMGDADSTYGKLNHIHRARYGSNNYAQSGIRQWLNSDAAANAWWQPTTIFDRPYSNRNTAGRLNTMDNGMKSVLATPTINCITNNLFESSSLDGTTFALQTAYTVKDKLFPVTHTEVNLSSTPNVDSILSYYSGAGNTDRIKYRADNGNAYYWWLRTPAPPYANHERVVHTSGALDYYGAFSTYGGVSACIIQ